jgi:hypothetical protein
LEKKYKSFSEFYPYYLSEHSNKANRTLHFLGTSLFFVSLIIGIISQQYKWFILMPIMGYGFAWVGHFFIEKNKPATFKYPLFSLTSDFYMYWHFITGQLDSELEQIKNNK